MVTLFLFIGISSIKIYSIFVAEMTIKLKYIILFMILLIDNISLLGQAYNIYKTEYQGFKIVSKDNNAITISHKLSRFEIEDNHIIMHDFINLPSDEGTPNLPSNSCYIAVPKNSNPKIELLNYKEKIIENIDINPAHKILSDLDTNVIYVNKSDIYKKNKFYPENIYNISESYSIRGHDLVLLNVNPFLYNPIERKLKVIYDINLEISYENDNKSENIDRLRSREWDNLLKNIVINSDMISDFDYDNQIQNVIDNNLDGCDYLIICPDNHEVLQWADSISRFRNEQGILTKVININDACENKPIAIRDYLNNIYQNWDYVPSAILLFGDYNNDCTKGISSFYLNNHPETGISYLTDNKLVDFNNDNLPEINISRIPVSNAKDAETITRKIFSYERFPSEDISYYNCPITSMGFQESRWFQLCSEIIHGFFAQKGKTPTRINAIYEGSPDSVWSTATNTKDIISYFGPDGLRYIPSNIKHLTDWTHDKYDLFNNINKGAFLVQHRDHGTFQNWGEPYLSNYEINNLQNKDLSFIMSANCQTGDFGFGYGDNDCLAERFLRTPNGAIGVIAASEISYSFVNDTYVWGFYDYLWNDFMPSYGGFQYQFKYPAFANVYGKYFLNQSSWPYLSVHKDITYNIFHYFGDAYLQLNTEIPQEIEIEYPNNIKSDCNSITISKDDNTRVALSINGRLIAVSNSNDSIINIKPLPSGSLIKVVATKQDHIRHEGFIRVTTHLQEDELSIYPNPASNEINVESIGIKAIIIYNNLGQEIMNIDNDNGLPLEHFKIDCSSLKNGLFHLQIIYEDKRVARSFIINRN